MTTKMLVAALVFLLALTAAMGSSSGAWPCAGAARDIMAASPLTEKMYNTPASVWDPSTGPDDALPSLLGSHSGSGCDSSSSVESGFAMGARLPLPLDELQYHGTTTLSFLCDGGRSVIVACDSRASMGDYVGSKTTKKIFPLSKHCVATMAGGAADCTHFIRYVTRLGRIMERRLGQPMPVKALARTLAAQLRQYRGMELSVGTMVAGVCPSSGIASIFYVDSEGSCVPGTRFAVGSGSQLAYAVLDSATPEHQQHRQKKEQEQEQEQEQEHHLQHMPPKQAVKLAARAIRTAAARDGYSGGYINVFIIDRSTGVRHVLRKTCDDDTDGDDSGGGDDSGDDSGGDGGDENGGGDDSGGDGGDENGGGDDSGGDGGDENGGGDDSGGDGGDENGGGDDSTAETL